VTTLDGRDYDIRFPDEGIGLELLRAGTPARPVPGRLARPVRGRFGPATLGTELIRLRDVPQIWADWSGGGGMTRPAEAIPGGYAYTRDLVTRYPGYVMPRGALTEVVVAIPGATLGACKAAFEKSGDLYFCCGRYVVRITGGTDPGPIITASKDLGANVVAESAIRFDGKVYVGTSGAGADATLWELDSGWSNLDPLTGVRTLVARRELASVYWEQNNPATGQWVGADRLVGNDTSTTIKTVARGSSPLSPGNWSGPIKVGDGEAPITSLVAGPRRLWIATSIGLFDMDFRGQPRLLNPYHGKQQDDTVNGVVSLFFGQFVYLSHVRGLDRVYVGEALRLQQEEGFCGPGEGLSNLTPVHGPVTAGTIEGGYLCVAQYNGTDSYVSYGRQREPGTPGHGPLRWWLGEVYLPGERVTLLFPHVPDDGSNPRLWICSVDAEGDTRIRWESLPAAPSPLQELVEHLDADGLYEGDHRWHTGGELYLTDETYGDGNARKVLLRYDWNSLRLNASTYLTAFARAEQGAWVNQGQVKLSPRDQLVPVDPLRVGHQLGFYVQFTGTNTAPPVLLELRARAEVISELRDSRDYLVVLGPARSLRNTGREVRDPWKVWAQLQRLQTRAPVPFQDEMGADLVVRVEPGMGYQEYEHAPDGPASKRRVLAASLTVTVIPQTADELALDSSGSPPTSSTRRRWGDGTLWGSGATWGS
jgi:hypothetical protein